MTSQITPSQTVGPFLSLGMPWPDGPFVVPAGTPGAVRITGRVTDGAGKGVPDGVIETWQADPAGRFAHPDDPRGVVDSADGSGGTDVPGGFRGFGRCLTDDQGGYEILTVKPGRLPAPEGGIEAPHIDVTVLARGLLNRVVTRIYFPDETEANDADPVLRSVEPGRRATLIAVPDGDGLRFDIHLQDSETGGESCAETVFFAV